MNKQKKDQKLLEGLTFKEKMDLVLVFSLITED